MKSNVLTEVTMPTTFVEVPTEKSETKVASPVDQKMLVYRLTEAARRIREETELIRRSSFSDTGARLMRILGETVEEQRQAIISRDGSDK